MRHTHTWVGTVALLALGCALGYAGVVFSKYFLSHALSRSGDTTLASTGTTQCTEQKDDIFFLTCGGIY